MVGRVVLFFAALVAVSIALILPYRARLGWFQIVGYVAHLPSRIFAGLSNIIMNRLDLDDE